MLALTASILSASPSKTQAPDQVFAGRISDSFCGASHQSRAGALTDRECVFECLRALATWTLVDRDGKAVEISNYDFPGLPLYAGRPVHITGELQDGAIVGSRIQAYPPHLHILHLMTNWRDTPGGVGLLIAALSDAKTAVAHSELAARSPTNLASMKTHAGHVLHALDPTIEAKGPASGYGVTRATAGASQHLQLAVKSEGASARVKERAVRVATCLTNAARWAAQAVDLAEQVQMASNPADATEHVTAMLVATRQLLDGAGPNQGGLAQAHAEMLLMLKDEGLENAPR